MANIISIGTAVPEFCHQQTDILQFMQNMYGLDDTQKRILSFLYSQSAIRQRYSVINDFSEKSVHLNQLFAAQALNPSISKRMEVYQLMAPTLAFNAIQNCLHGKAELHQITHLITVSCTGMSAPGIDLQLVEILNLPNTVFRTSVNFMGCYAAIHALKMANYICKSEPDAVVVIVAVELCTLHFQPEFTEDNAASSLLFADGAAAVLVSGQAVKTSNQPMIALNSFYSKIERKGKNDMAWIIGNHGFEMTLSSFIPSIIEADIEELVHTALENSGYTLQDIQHWCIHPGGRKIIDVIEKQLGLTREKTRPSRFVLENFGNMSSPTLLFVLKEMMQYKPLHPEPVFGIAFGPGLTMETFTAQLI
ncbi:MAG: type III polyketide synthase [Bacteroidota bacterium]|nr:type III polyketide synthase [Bacteroidota bacterium]